MVARYATSVLGSVVVVAAILRFTVFAPYLMSGSSMEPTLLPGEYILATRGGAERLRHDDIAVIRCDHPEPRICVKRVIALGGDRVEFTEGIVSVNGKTQPKLLANANKEPLIVPPGSFFAVNDSAADGEDSRVWGPVSAESFEGRVRLIWLSLDWFDAAGEVRDFPKVRWDRIFSFVR